VQHRRQQRPATAAAAAAATARITVNVLCIAIRQTKATASHTSITLNATEPVGPHLYLPDKHRKQVPLGGAGRSGGSHCDQLLLTHRVVGTSEELHGVGDGHNDDDGRLPTWRSFVRQIERRLAVRWRRRRQRSDGARRLYRLRRRGTVRPHSRRSHVGTGQRAQQVRPGNQHLWLRVWWQADRAPTRLDLLRWFIIC